MKRMLAAVAACIFVFLGTPGLCGAEQEYHVLQQGETLYSVAKAYNLPYEVLASSNGITDPTKVKAGTVLLIPRVHIVQKGETLFGIARMYGLTVQELRLANNLSESYVLKVGDVLRITAAAGTASAQASQAAQAPAQNAGQPASSTSSSPAPVQPAAATSVPATSGAHQAASATGHPSASQAPAPQQAPVPSPSQSAASSTAQQSGSAPAAGASPAKPGSPPVASAPPASSIPATQAPQATPSSPSQGKDRTSVDTLLIWPVEGTASYLNGKLEGIQFKTVRGAPVRAIASGTVVSAGASRGYGEVVFIQNKAGFVYVYGGNETLLVKTGDVVESGKIIAKVGIDARNGSAVAYFFVFRNGQPVDPALAPRE